MSRHRLLFTFASFLYWLPSQISSQRQVKAIHGEKDTGRMEKTKSESQKNVRNLAKWMFRCFLRWANLTDNLKPIYLFLFSSPIFTAFPHCLEKLWCDPSGGFGVGKPKSAVWEAVPITESDSGWSHSMHTSSKRARVSQSIHDLRRLMSPQAYIRDLVSPSHLNI